MCQPPDRLTLTLSTDPLTAALRRTLAARREQIKAALDPDGLPDGEACRHRRDVFRGLAEALMAWADDELADLDDDLDDDMDEWPDLAPPPVAESVVVTDDDGETD